MPKEQYQPSEEEMDFEQLESDFKYGSILQEAALFGRPTTEYYFVMHLSQNRAYTGFCDLF